MGVENTQTINMDEVNGTVLTDMSSVTGSKKRSKSQAAVVPNLDLTKVLPNFSKKQ